MLPLFFPTISSEADRRPRAVDAFAAASASISGASSFEPHYLVTSDRGLVTVTLENPEEIQDVSCAWKELNRNLSSNAVSQMTRMCPKRKWGCLLWCSHTWVREDTGRAAWLRLDTLRARKLPEAGEYHDGNTSCNSRQRSGWSSGRPGRQAIQVGNLVASRVGRVNREVTQEVGKTVEGKMGTEIDQEVEATSGVLTENLIVNLPVWACLFLLNHVHYLPKCRTTIADVCTCHL